MLRKGILPTPLFIAFCLAALLHITLLLGLSFNATHTKVSNEEPRLTIHIRQPLKQLQQEKESAPVVQTSPEFEKPLLEQPLPKVKPKNDAFTTQVESEVIIYQSPNSKEFKQWLRKESENYVNNNTQSSGDFLATFDPVLPPPIDADTEYQTTPMVGGQYKVRRKGKVICTLKMVPQSFDDFVDGAPSGGVADCTPKKKFTLNLK